VPRTSRKFSCRAPETTSIAPLPACKGSAEQSADQHSARLEHNTYIIAGSRDRSRNICLSGHCRAGDRTHAPLFFPQLRVVRSSQAIWDRKQDAKRWVENGVPSPGISSERRLGFCSMTFVVTVPGNEGKELASGTLNPNTQEGRAEVSARRYSIVIERTGTGYSAYSPGCAAFGDTEEGTRRNFQDALIEHFQVMREVGEPIPEPHTSVDYVEVAA
jgi:predicted RNase H-like HicB family nuclease